MLNPALFGILVADLTHEFKAQFPDDTTTHNERFKWTWIGPGKLPSSVSDLNCWPRTPDDVGTCQIWIEKARMQLNTDKTKVMWYRVRNCGPHVVQGQISRNHTSPQYTEKTIESSGSKTVVSVISNPLHVPGPRLYQDKKRKQRYSLCEAR